MSKPKKKDLIANELAKLSRRRGFLTPQQVVAAAKDQKSPLHGCFTWDDSKAAHAHRLWQARELIASVEFEPTKDHAPFRAYVHIRNDGEVDGRYVSTIDALSDPETRKVVLQRALGDLDRVRERYEQLSELASVWRAIKKAAE
jgi:hypothetical protein